MVERNLKWNRAVAASFRAVYTREIVTLMLTVSGSLHAVITIVVRNLNGPKLIVAQVIFKIKHNTLDNLKCFLFLACLNSNNFS